MRFRRFQKPSALLLSVLVLSWGTVLPSMQHAHVGGDDTIHCHTEKPTPAAVDHVHSHGNGDHHHPPASPTEPPPSPNPVDHLHWNWLGLDFSTPFSGDPSESEKDQNNDPTALAGNFAKVESISVSRQMPDEVLRNLRALSVTPIESPSPATLEVAGPETSIPLCESARRERTGVLLA